MGHSGIWAPRHRGTQPGTLARCYPGRSRFDAGLHVFAVSAGRRRRLCSVAVLARCNCAPCVYAGFNRVSRCSVALVSSLVHSGIRAASGHVGPFGHSGTVAICNGGQWATADRWSARPAWLHNDKRATVVSGPGPGPESGYLGMGAAMRRAIAVVVSVATLVADTPAVPPRGISCITWLDHTGPLGHVPFRPGSSSPPGVRQLGWRSYLCLGAITAWKPEPGAPRPISERRGALQEDQQSASRPQAMPAVPRSPALPDISTRSTQRYGRCQNSR